MGFRGIHLLSFLLLSQGIHLVQGMWMFLISSAQCNGLVKVNGNVHDEKRLCAR